MSREPSLSDSPEQLLQEAREAARRLWSPAARDNADVLTPYGIVVEEQFRSVADLLATTPGATIGDARAFAWAAEKITSTFTQSVLAGQADWRLYTFALQLLGRLSECLEALARAEAAGRSVQ
jgi:hypothetical protein